MDISLIMWLVFWITVSLALFIDLIILGRRTKDISIKDAGKMTSVWVGLAVFFGIFIFVELGMNKAIEFFAGYAVEYSLSIDNMFVFLVIFSYFSIPKKFQPKVLICGILGAVFLRFIFVFAGVKLINNFSWFVYIFGAILLCTAIKMLISDNKNTDINNNWAFKILKKIFPMSESVDKGNFFERKGSTLYITPIFASVIVIEASDIVFAVDSIPAILSITSDTFIVYSSNIFAVLGLRSLYFLLAGLADKFKYIKYGVIVILFFVGVKMIVSHYYHISSLISLITIVFILLASIIFSIYKTKTKI
jgi:tellurite resistance protein TerC